jgi:integrase
MVRQYWAIRHASPAPRNPATTLTGQLRSRDSIQVKSFKRAWQRALLVSHGHKPAYVVRAVTAEDGTISQMPTAVLTPESRATLKAINLHFHDLRRAAGSRWLDGGIPLTAIRDWLGHSNISQTSTYLETQTVGQNDLMRRYEERQAAALAPIGTAAGKRGHKKALAAIVRDKRVAKTTGKHQIQ